MASPVRSIRRPGRPGEDRTSPGSHVSSGSLFVLYGRLLGLLLAGYLLFDRAFAYLRPPGAPLFVGEIVLGVGVAAVLMATRYLAAPMRGEPILALLAAFALWGLWRTVPGSVEYGMDALRDAALWYYSSFAFLTAAALARWPELIDHLLSRLARLTPWMLTWLSAAVVLPAVIKDPPTVPFSTVSVLSHKPGNAAIAALLALGCMWLFPDLRSTRSRTVWSATALVVIALAATQNRGGLLGVVAGAAVGLAFMPDRARLVARAVVVALVGLGLASALSLKVPVLGGQGREFSASQLVTNVLSLGAEDSPGNLAGTVRGRQELWTQILDKQVADDRLVDGSGFGPNLAADVGVYDAGKDTLRSPHNSHLHVLARMGLVGLVLWVLFWLAFYWRMVIGCRRLARRRQQRRRGVAVLSVTVTTAVLVSSTFDPQLEGPQVAVLLWTAVGVGVAATSDRPWFRYTTPGAPSAPTRGRRQLVRRSAR